MAEEVQHLEFVPRGPWFALQGEPLLNGDSIEVWLNNQWRAGRFRWSGDLDERPELETSAGTLVIPPMAPVRWPTASGPIASARNFSPE